jgi:hypothetical protein
MLDLVALSILFLIVTIAVPFTAASVAGGTVGLALSHAFEAAVIARTVVRPITNTLQSGFNKVSQMGSGRAEASGWVNAMDFGHRTEQISNLGPDHAPRVPAPTDVGPTTRLNGASTRSTGGAPTTGMGKRTRKV